MPALLVPLLGFIGITGAAAQIASALIVAAVSLAASYALQKLTARKQKQPPAQKYQETVRQSVAPRRRSYGTVLVSGPMAFYEARGNYVYILVLMNAGSIENIDEWWIADKQVLIDGNNDVVTSPYRATFGANSKIRLEWGLGYVDQVSSPILNAAFTEWTSDHRLSGIAWTLMRLTKVVQESFQPVYNNTTPSIRQTMRSSLIYDPRDAGQTLADPNTWESSETPALQLFDYMTTRWGMWLSRDLFDIDAFATEADVCDDFVPLRLGGSEPRYASSGTFELTDPPTDIIERILTTCGGLLYLTAEGLVAVEVDRWYEPDFTITDDDIKAWDMNAGVGRLQAYRAIRAKFTSVAHAYKEQSTEPITIAGATAGTVIIQDFDMPWVKSNSQALRLAKLKLYRDNPQYAGTLTLGPTGLRLLAQRRFRLTTSILDIDEVCEIKRLTVAGDLSSVRVDFTTLDPEGYEWDPATEESDPPPVPADTSEDPALVTPSGLRALTGKRGGVMWAGVSWNTAASAAHTQEFRFKLVGADYTSLTVPTGQNFIEWSGLTEAADYTAEVRFKDSLNNVSSWAAVSFTATDDTATPAAPSGLAATGLSESIEASATQSASSNAFVIEFYEADVGVSSPSFSPVGAVKAVAPSAASGDVVVPATAGSRRIWARARSVANVVSTNAGPVAVTVGGLPTGDPGGSSGSGGSSGGGGGGAATGGGSDPGGGGDPGGG